jgi:hypothetical protein
MNFKEIVDNFECSLNLLRVNDKFLFQHNVNERSIAHKFAEYLSIHFSSYDVDCEYNSNVEANKGKKYITFLKDKAKELGLLRERDLDDEIVYRNVFPDIIIHKRGSNKFNLLIIEMKKSSSKINCDYDIEKLKRYTSPDYENTLIYSFGALVYLGVENNLGNDCIEWFEKGNKKPNW